MKLTSSSFVDGGEIPRKHGYKTDNTSPSLEIRDIPSNTQSLALIMDDPDAVGAVGKIWVHWVVWNIKPDALTIQENSIPDGAQEGETDFGKIGYGGPAPPDKKHTYIFNLYALDNIPDVKKGAKKIELEEAIKNHIIEKAVLTGTYAP
jgi:Raf kinase inhibitor-like YbhB/YbcL family protein